MIKNKLTVYLAGYSEELEYRKIVKDKYGNDLILIDPMQLEMENNIKEDLGYNNYIFIIRKDQKLILESDILVAYINIGSTFGTTMEICFAKNNNIKVYVIDPYNKFRYDVWLKYHTDKFFDSIEECFDYITVKKPTPPKCRTINEDFHIPIKIKKWIIKLWGCHE